jgi:hypothetical protein
MVQGKNGEELWAMLDPTPFRAHKLGQMELRRYRWQNQKKVCFFI